MPPSSPSACVSRSPSRSRACPHELRVTASVGVALLAAPDAAHTAEVIIALADQAMYAAKTGGRNRIEMLRVQGGGVPV